MSILPMLTSRQLLAILLKAGFKIIRQRGSHMWLEHPVLRRTTMVAMHTKDVSRKMLSKIIKQAGLSTAEFLRLLGK